MAQKHRKGQKKSQGRYDKKRKSISLWVGGIILGVVLVWVLTGYFPFGTTGSKKGRSFYVQGGETRPVLSPSLFVGRANGAYAAAKQYPKLMDQVFCYCKCDEPPTYHKSLLSCFTDRHGEG
jgi:hypothetical protein